MSSSTQDPQAILCIGEALIDMICTDVNVSLEHGEHFLKKAGGAPTNVAAAIAALGGEVSLAAMVGNDPFGRHLTDVLQGFGVNIKYVLNHPAAFTSFAYVSLMEDGERDFYFNRGADAELGEADVQGIDPADFSVVHFGSATAFLPGALQESYRLMLQRSTAAGRFISFDPNYRELLYRDKKPSFVKQSLEFLRQADFYKMSEEEAMLIAGSSTVNDAVAALMQLSQGVLAITLGKEGALLACKGKTTTVETVPAKAIDTTGAGDAFVGAVLAQIQTGGIEQVKSFTLSDWQPIIFKANKAGARTCEYMGAMEAFAHLSTDIFA